MAIIPALGAMPFFGKNIVKEDKKIIIEEPKQIEIVQDIPYDIGKEEPIQVLLAYKGRVFASAGMEYNSDFESCIDDMSLECYNTMVRSPRLTIRASFNEDKVTKAFIAARKYRYR